MCDIIYRELINDMTWSYSRITCFENCPYSFYLKYIRGEKGNPKFYSSYGSFVHKLLEKYYKDQIAKEELSSDFLLGFKENVAGDRPQGSTVSKYINQTINYFNTFKDFDYNKVSVEEKAKFNIGENPFVGFIDYLGEKDGEFYIIDNKSSDIKPRSKKEKPTVADKQLDKKLRQLYLYAAIVKNAYGKFPKGLCFNCYRTGAFIKEPFYEQKYEQTIKWALDTIEEIKDTNDFRPNIEYFYCKNLCPFSEDCLYWLNRGV